MPFYRSNGPRTYLGWGKSHGLGTGLGLVIGAKLAQPDKVCVNFMGDAAFGMVGLDFETAVRSNIPIITVVLNNSTMAAEVRQMADSHRLYGTRDLGGNYADMGRAMGGYAERIEDPGEVSAAFTRARRVTEQEGRGRAAGVHHQRRNRGGQPPAFLVNSTTERTENTEFFRHIHGGFVTSVFSVFNEKEKDNGTIKVPVCCQHGR